METPRKRGLQKQLSKSSYKKKWKNYITNYMSVQGELPSPKLVHKICTMEETDNFDTLKEPKVETEDDVSLERSSSEEVHDKASEASSDDTDKGSPEDDDNGDSHSRGKHDKNDAQAAKHGPEVDVEDDDDNDTEETEEDVADSSSSSSVDDAEPPSASSDDENKNKEDTQEMDDRILTLKPNTTSDDILASVLALAVRQEMDVAATLSVLTLFTWISSEMKMPTTAKEFYESISREDDPSVESHMYCRKCHAVMGIGTVPKLECTCGVCGPGKPQQEMSYFVKISVKDQLQKIFSIPKIQEQLDYRFNRKKHHEAGIEDIYDGTEYKKLTEPGCFLDSRWNYSFTVSIDCCEINKSLKAWPVVLTVNEFPPALRKRHVILGGIWVDANPPNLNSYLLPIFNELWSLYTTGITWRPDVVNNVTSKFTTVLCLVGSHLRSDILNMNNFDEEYGCADCYTKGTKKPHIGRVYPTEEAPKRSNKEMRNHMAEATTTGNSLMGVKGNSIALIIPEFDLVRGTVVDSMDVVFLGVAKELTQLFICGKPTDPWYRGDRRSLKKINAVDLRPTESIGRVPKRIESHKTWDATDWKHWLLYYSVPSLFQIIRRTDHELVVMLSEAAHLVSGNALTRNGLKAARKLIKKFIRAFQSTFGEGTMTYNIHHLGHLADTIQCWGPLWVHSSYPFKCHNKAVIKMAKSQEANPLQLSSGYFVRTFIENISYNSTVGHTTKELVLTTLNSDREGSPEFYLRKGDFRDFHGIGRPKRRPPVVWQSKLLKDLGFECASKITRFNQALIKGIKYSCKGYSPKTDEDESPTMLYTKKKFLGEILSIVSFIDVNGETVNGAFYKLMSDTGNRFNAAHIRQFQETRERCFVVVDDVLAPAIILNIYETRHAVRLAIPWE